MKEYKLCASCDEIKHHTEFYTYKGKYKLANCKQCTAIKERENYKREVEEKGGSFFVYATPGVFSCEIQKEGTFNILKVLGYQLNEELNIWWKPGVKEIVDGKPVFLKLRKGPGKDKIELINKVFELHKSGMNGKQISKKINVNPSTIYKILRNGKVNQDR